MSNAIILFDGVCNFCNGMVNFIVRHDPDGYFKLGSLQSEAGQTLLKQYGVSQTDLNTIVLIENGEVFLQSTAVLKIFQRLSGGWSILYDFIVIPHIIRDPFYDLFAKYRYKIFGMKDVCRIPTEEE